MKRFKTPHKHILICIWIATLFCGCAHTPVRYTPRPTPATQTVYIHFGDGPQFQNQLQRIQDFRSARAFTIPDCTPPHECTTKRTITPTIFNGIADHTTSSSLSPYQSQDQTVETLNRDLKTLLSAYLPAYNIAQPTTDPYSADLILTGSVFAQNNPKVFAVSWHMIRTDTNQVIAADLRTLRGMNPLNALLHSLFWHLLPKPRIATHLQKYPYLTTPLLTHDTP